MIEQPTSHRTFVPADLDFSDFGKVEPLYQELVDRPIDSAGELERFLADFSEIAAAQEEYGTRRYIDKSCHTDDPAKERAFLDFVEHVDGPSRKFFFALRKKFLASPHRAGLDSPKLALMARYFQADVDIYRDANVPLETEIAKLVSEYDKITGAQTVTLDGVEYTLPQAARFLDETDRGVRERAWRATAERQLRDYEACESLFDRLLALRERVARNADLPDYRAFIWKAYKRFDYTPDDCLRFADALAETVVPLVDEINARRAADLGLERLRPWDRHVDPLGRPPLRPFARDDAARLTEGTRAILARLSPALAEEFGRLGECGTLDLVSRKGKQPGGYMSHLPETKVPFIFMNAAGTHEDVSTLLHEGGHALHFLACDRHEPLLFLRIAPVEFIEVPSMAMELLGAEHYDVFYPDPADAARAKRDKLEGVIRLLPWIGIVDSFQHWLYTHPGHSRTERTAHWVSLLDRLGRKLDWTGLEVYRESSWPSQLHLFHQAFYYIEYGIAQLGALQVWLKSKEDPRRAVANYRASLNLAGTRSLPELFAAAGARFDFSAATLRPLMNAVREELESLPR